MKNPLVVTIIVALLVGAGAFFGGMKYQQTKQSAARLGAGQNNGRFQANGNARTGMRPTSGQIIGTDTDSITVKMQDGSTKIVLLNDKTTINKTAIGMKDDLKVGTTVAVFGTDNTDGSVSAASVQINPTLSAGMNRQEPNEAVKSADAKEFVVEAANYTFSPNTITVKNGEKVRIILKNGEGMHDLKIDAFNVSTAIIPGDQEDFFEFTADKTGSFEYYCTVGNHRQMGMKGTLIVQ